MSITPTCGSSDFFKSIELLFEGNDDFLKCQKVALSALNNAESHTIIVGTLTHEDGEGKKLKRIKDLTNGLEMVDLKERLSNLLIEVEVLKQEKQVTFISQDGVEINVNSELIKKTSVTIKNLLEGAQIEGSIPIPNIKSTILNQIIRYLQGERPAITRENIVEFYTAANYLDSKGLLQECNFWTNVMLSRDFDTRFAISLLNDPNIKNVVDLGYSLGKKMLGLDKIIELVQKKNKTDEENLLITCLEKTTSLYVYDWDPYTGDVNKLTNDLQVLEDACPNLKNVSINFSERLMAQENAKAKRKLLDVVFSKSKGDVKSQAIATAIFRELITTFSSEGDEFSLFGYLVDGIYRKTSPILPNKNFFSLMLECMPQEEQIMTRAFFTTCSLGLEKDLSAYELYQIVSADKELLKNLLPIKLPANCQDLEQKGLKKSVILLSETIAASLIIIAIIKNKSGMDGQAWLEEQIIDSKIDENGRLILQGASRAFKEMKK